MESTSLSWSSSGVYQESIRSIRTLSGLLMESIRSPSGVHQESIRSLSGVHQEYQDFIRTPDGLHQDSWGSVTYSVSASATRKSRRAFLVSLSSDINYKKLQLLLYAAKVSKEVL